MTQSTNVQERNELYSAHSRGLANVARVAYKHLNEHGMFGIDRDYPFEAFKETNSHIYATHGVAAVKSLDVHLNHTDEQIQAAYTNFASLLLDRMDTFAQNFNVAECVEEYEAIQEIEIIDGVEEMEFHRKKTIASRVTAAIAAIGSLYLSTNKWGRKGIIPGIVSAVGIYAANEWANKQSQPQQVVIDPIEECAQELSRYFESQAKIVGHQIASQLTEVRLH